jgi:hypothetical protein
MRHAEARSQWGGACGCRHMWGRRGVAEWGVVVVPVDLRKTTGDYCETLRKSVTPKARR